MVIFAVVSGVLIFLWIRASRVEPEAGQVVFRSFSEDSTATVAFAGQFPAEDADPLARPLALDGDGERLYVADGDAGVVIAYTYEGAATDTITVDPAGGAAAFYPVDVAVLSDGRLALVDASAPRVLVVDSEAKNAPTAFTTAEEAPSQPTAIDAADGLVVIADATTAAIRVFEEDGSFVRDIGTDMETPLTFVGGLALNGGRVYVSDSNAGRVLVLDVETGEVVTILEQRFELPRGLVPVRAEEIAIVEGFGGQVVLFDVESQEQTDVIGDDRTEYYEKGGNLTTPEAVFWDAEGERLFVADPSVGRVKVYLLREPVKEPVE